MRVHRGDRLSRLCQPHLDGTIAEGDGYGAAVRREAEAVRVARVEELRL